VSTPILMSCCKPLNAIRRFDRRNSGREAAAFQQQLCSGVLASFWPDNLAPHKLLPSAATPDSTSTGSIYLYTYIHIHILFCPSYDPHVRFWYASDRDDLRHAMPASVSIADPAGACRSKVQKLSRQAFPIKYPPCGAQLRPGCCCTEE